MKMDVQIVVDGSDSVTEQNFNTLNKLINKDLIGAWDISPTATKVAYIYYANHPVMPLVLDEIHRHPPRRIYKDGAVRNETDKELVQRRIYYNRYKGGRRNTGQALIIAYTYFELYMRTSPDVLKTLIVFTNGETDKEDVYSSQKWSKQFSRGLGAKVFAVGIGYNISQKGLESIAGSFGQTLRIHSYEQEDIRFILDHIKNELCHTPIDFQTNFQIRLAGGTDTTGRVEILFGQSWGTICIDSRRRWRTKRIKFSEVVCRQLGLGLGSPVTNPPFKQGPGQILLDYIKCRGNETNIGQCHHRGAHRATSGVPECPDGVGVIAGVSCSPFTN